MMDAHNHTELLDPDELGRIATFASSLGGHIREHLGHHEFRPATMPIDGMCEGVVRGLFVTWADLTRVLDHLHAVGGDLDPRASVRLVLGHYGATVRAIQPSEWQAELLHLIERADTLHRAELATAYPGLVQCVTVQEEQGLSGLYRLLDALEKGGR